MQKRERRADLTKPYLPNTFKFLNERVDSC